MAAGVVKFQIEVDPSNGLARIGDVETRFKKLGENAQNAGRQGSGGLKQLFSSVVDINQALELGQKAWRAIQGPVWDIITTASHAREVSSQFLQVFKGEAPAAQKFVDDLSAAINRNRTEVKEAMASFQDTFVPLGFARDKARELSEVIVKLGYDYSSFKDVDAKKVFEDIQSAVVGNHETTRKYGIIITQSTIQQELWAMGIQKSVTKASELEKVLARINIIKKASTDAEGDAIRTAYEWANQIRALEATFAGLKETAGNAIIDTLLPHLQKINEWVKNNKEEIEKVAVQAGKFIADLIVGLADVGKWLVDHKDLLIGIGKATLVAWGTKKVANLGTALVGAVGGAKGLLTKLGSLKGLALTATTVMGNFGLIAAAAFAGWGIGTLLNDFLGLTEYFATIHEWEMKLIYEAADKRYATERSKQTQAYNEEIRELGNELGVTSGRVRDNAVAIYNNKEEFEKLRPELQAAVKNWAQNTAELKAHEEAQRLAAEKAEKLRLEKEKLKAAIEKEKIALLQLKKEMGLTTISKGDLLKQTNRLEKVLDNSDGWMHQSKAVKKVGSKVKELIEGFKSIGEEVPEELLKLDKAITRSTTKVEDWEKAMDKEIVKEMRELTDGLKKHLKPAIVDFGDELKTQQEILAGGYSDAWNVMGTAAANAVSSTTSTLNLQMESIKAFPPTFQTVIDQITDSTRTFLEKTISTFDGLGIFSQGFIRDLTAIKGGFDSISEGLDVLNDKNSGTLDNLFAGVNMISGGFSVLKKTFNMIKDFFSANWKARSRVFVESIGGASAEMVNKLAELAEEMGNVSDAYARLLDEFILDANIETRSEFQRWLKETIRLVSRMRASGGDLSDVEDAFETLAQVGGENLGYLGRDFIALVNSVEQSKLPLQALADFMKNEMKEAAAAYADYLESDFSTVTIGVFDEYLDYQKRIEENQGLINGIKGFTRAIQGFGNTSRQIFQTDLDAFMQGAQDSFNALKAVVNDNGDAVFSNKEALKQIAPTLATIQQMAKDWNLEIDDGTQKLIDQAKQAGITFDTVKGPEEQMLDTMKEMVKILQDAFPPAINDMANSAITSLESIQDQTHIWQNSLVGVQNEIGNIKVGIDDLDEEWKKRVSGNTITAENEKWQESLKNINQELFDLKGEITIFDQEYYKITRSIDDYTRENFLKALEDIENQMADALPDELDLLEEKYKNAMAEMQFATQDLYLDADGVLRTLREITLEAGRALSIDLGSRYEVYNETEKQDMTAQMFAMLNIWGENREFLLSDVKRMERFFEDFSRLEYGIIDDVKTQEQFDYWKTSLGNWLAHLKKGQTWDPGTRTWTDPPKTEDEEDEEEKEPDIYAATGFETWLNRPTNIDIGGKRIRAAEAGEKELFALIPESRFKQSGGNRQGDVTIINQITINPTSATPEEHAKCLIEVLEKNRYGVRTKIKDMVK